jgi:hypothetical protein
MNEQAVNAATDAVALKAATASTGLGWLLTLDASTAIVGVPINVLLAGLTGALLGVIYGKPLAKRRDAVAAVAVNAFVASAVSAILPHVPLVKVIGAAPASAVALVLAFAARWAVPAAIERIPTVLEKIMGRAAPKGEQ